MTETHLFFIIFMSAGISLGLSPLATRFCRRIGLMDIPRREEHKVHHRPEPLAGGIILFLTFIILSIVEGFALQNSFLTYLIPFCIILIFGIVDDFVSLNPLIKLAGQILASIVLILNNVSVQLFPNNAVNIFLTIFWLVGITNAFNFTDSMDGLDVGLAATSAACLVMVTLQKGQSQLTLMSTIILGSCLGIYFFNAHPAHYFLGDSGAQFLGFFMATVAVEYTPVGYTHLTSWFVPILLVGVPIFDTVLVVVSRLRRRMPIYKGSLDHTYHRLVRLGVNPNRAILCMHLCAVMLDCIAFILLGASPMVANGTILLLGILALAAIIYLDRPHLLEDNPYPNI